MLQKLSFAVVLLVIIQFATGQKILLGSCKKPTQVEDFDVSRYVGRWYEFETYPHIFELFEKCGKADYSISGNNTLRVLNSAINTLTGRPTSISGVAKVLGSGILNVKFPQGGFLPQSDKANYFVAGTDYTTFSVVLSCTDLLGTHAQFVWCLTREKIPTEQTIAKINEVLVENMIPQKYLKRINQSCPSENA